MPILVNTAEGGFPGTAVTTANSGGGSGSAFDTVSTGAGATLNYDSTHAAHGSLSFEFIYPGTARDIFLRWTTSMGTQAQVWFRYYAYFTVNPGTNLPMFASVASGTLCSRMFLTTAGKLIMTSTTGSTVLTSTGTVPLNAWFRVEGFVTGSASTGQIEFRLFDSKDSTVPAEIQTSAANINTGSSAMTQYDFGDSTTAISSVGPLWLDDIGLSSTGYLGPDRHRSSSSTAALIAAGII